MDASRGFFAQLLAGTGLAVSKEVTLVAVFVLAVIIVAVGLAVRRRGDRLAERFEDPHLRDASVREVEPDVLRAHEAVADAPSDLDRSKQDVGEPNRQKSEPSGDLAKLAADLASMRETIGKTAASNVPGTRGESMTARESVQDYQGRIELLQATLTSLQSEQLTLRKLLEACNAGLKSIEPFVAAVRSIRTEHASIRN
jgi:chromosome segregation ATPase